MSRRAFNKQTQEGFLLIDDQLVSLDLILNEKFYWLVVQQEKWYVHSTDAAIITR